MARPGYIGRLSPDNNDTKYRIAHTLFGVCNSAGSASTKVVELVYNTADNEINPTLSQDWLLDGLTLVVQFTQANTAQNLKLQFTGQSALFPIVGTSRVYAWAENTALVLTYRSAAASWYISGAPGTSVYQSTVVGTTGAPHLPLLFQDRSHAIQDVIGPVMYSYQIYVTPADNSITASKFKGDIEVPNAKVELTLEPSYTAQTSGFSTSLTIHWAQVGPVVVIESDADMPETPQAQCEISHGEHCIVFQRSAGETTLLPPPPVSRLSANTEGVAVSRMIMLGGPSNDRPDPLFVKYRRGLSGDGQIEIYNPQGHQQPFTLAYIANTSA